MTATDPIRRLLSSVTWPPAPDEYALQGAVEQLLTDEGIGHTRECALSPFDRVDFITHDGIVIECKVKGSLDDLTRQVRRYLDCPAVEGVVVLTRRAEHRDLELRLYDHDVRVVFTEARL